jgi:hypothetical protein
MGELTQEPEVPLYEMDLAAVAPLKINSRCNSHERPQLPGITAPQRVRCGA